MHQHQPAKTLHEGIAGLKGFGLVAHFIRLCRLLYFLHGFYYGEIISSFCGQSIKCGGGSNRAFIRHPLVKQFLPLPACRAGDTAGLHLEACQSFLQAPSSYTPAAKLPLEPAQKLWSCLSGFRTHCSNVPRPRNGDFGSNPAGWVEGAGSLMVWGCFG